MTRGRLLELVGLLFGEFDSLRIARPQRGNSLVVISGGEKTVILADDSQLETTGTDDEREVPLWFAHRVIAILRTYLEEPADLKGAMLAYMESVK